MEKEIFKQGMKVKFRDDLEVGMHYEGVGYTTFMNSLKGIAAEIVTITSEGPLKIEFNDIFTNTKAYLWVSNSMLKADRLTPPEPNFSKGDLVKVKKDVENVPQILKGLVGVVVGKVSGPMVIVGYEEVGMYYIKPEHLELDNDDDDEILQLKDVEEVKTEVELTDIEYIQHFAQGDLVKLKGPFNDEYQDLVGREGYVMGKSDEIKGRVYIIVMFSDDGRLCFCDPLSLLLVTKSSDSNITVGDGKQQVEVGINDCNCSLDTYLSVNNNLLENKELSNFKVGTAVKVKQTAIGVQPALRGSEGVVTGTNNGLVFVRLEDGTQRRLFPQMLESREQVAQKYVTTLHADNACNVVDRFKKMIGCSNGEAVELYTDLDYTQDVTPKLAPVKGATLMRGWGDMQEDPCLLNDLLSHIPKQEKDMLMFRHEVDPRVSAVYPELCEGMKAVISEDIEGAYRGYAGTLCEIKKVGVVFIHATLHDGKEVVLLKELLRPAE